MQKTLLSCLFSVFLLCSATAIFGQNQGQTQPDWQGRKLGSWNPRDVTPDFYPVLTNLEAPAPGGNSYRSHLLDVKAKSAERFPRKVAPQYRRSGNAPEPEQGFNTGVYHYFTGDPLTGGRPNDNTIAISDGNFIVTSWNTFIYALDASEDTLLFNHVSFTKFADQLSLSSPFDPKLKYDPIADRFILVFLSGRTPTDSEIIVCFSSSNNPADPWNIYAITGNPNNDNTWTDYPAMGLTQDELFVTVNLLRENEPWQTGFAESIIWQIDLEDGYNGASNLNTRLWQDVSFDGRPLRNLHPVQAGSGPAGPAIYLLSNRNFDIQNDSVFLVEVSGNLSDPNAVMSVKAMLSDQAYGAPPNAIQPNGHEFDTNDGRVLGAFIENGSIQFVSNSIDTTTGSSAIFHGIVDNPQESAPTVHGNLISNPVVDYGYANLAYVGTGECDNNSILAFNHSGAEVFAGNSAMYFDGLDEYSPVVVLKEGENYVDRITGTYERWGDYIGIQRKYNEPGKVFSSGYYSLPNKVNSTWISEIGTAGSELYVPMTLDADNVDVTEFLNCNGEITVLVSGGREPYTYLWNDAQAQNTVTATGLCNGSYEVTVTDGCDKSSTFSVSLGSNAPITTLFPNPTFDKMTVLFVLEEEVKDLRFAVYDSRGSLTTSLMQTNGSIGQNSFSFSTLPLQAGVYVLRITRGDDDEIYTETFIKAGTPDN